ncbi:MAG: HepT-like ribonuclease domain-containing protein [Pseudomonadota bacterium]
MSSPAQARSHEAEVEFLEGLRSRYEAEGFTFMVAPDRSVLPDFLGTYLPDALAQKPGQNVAIEVKRHQSQAIQAQLQDIRRLFDGHPDWLFSVVFMGTGPLPSVTIQTASPADIRRRISEARALSDQGYQRPAFVMAWSLLEAALQSVDEEKSGKARTPGTVVQTLAMHGYLSPDLERQMRELIQLRNRIVHGDVLAEPRPEDVALVLSAIEETLSADAA